ncbi:MAG: cytochrome c oxidase subunit 3 family protein [Phycisphaeraceae bacterium]|nr:cytochrome c oxidase subunit 3 family protein [Phycisphaeraceae bacterium]
MSDAAPTTEPVGHDDHGHHGPPHLAHHFDSLPQQVASGKLGMWIFLGTELLMFGGLFCFYSVLRRNNFEQFDIGYQYLDTFMGAFNTVVLLVSSFTMAWAVRAAQLGKNKQVLVLCLATLLGGAGFMVVKYLEYSHKHHVGVFVGELGSWETFQEVSDKVHEKQSSGNTVPVVTDEDVSKDRHKELLHLHAHEMAHDLEGWKPAEASAQKNRKMAEYAWEADRRLKARSFFSIYFCMTGLHGIHVLIGMGLIGWVALRAAKGAFCPRYNAPVDLVGLYWHLVDLIWIFLFPLLYLIK